jgi:MOSC domain-containing protein YiiM
MSGTLEAIWLKRAHRGVMDPVLFASLVPGKGLANDVNRSRRRQVTLLEAEAWEAMMDELTGDISPAARRANFLVRGIRLEKTRGQVLVIGTCRLQVGGETTPCERMDEALPGLQRAMTPHWRGGAFAQVLEGGDVAVGDGIAWELVPA